MNRIWAAFGLACALTLVSVGCTNESPAPTANRAAPIKASPASAPSTSDKAPASATGKAAAAADPADPEELEDFAEEVESSIDTTNYKRELSDLEKELR